MSYTTFSGEDNWSEQGRSAKRKWGEMDDSPYEPWRMKSSHQIIDGVPRIRVFTNDYLSGPVADPDVVIAALPRVRVQKPGSTREYVSLRRLKDFDHIDTNSTYGSEHSDPTINKSGEKGRRSRRNHARRTKVADEEVTRLNEEFKHIEVHRAPVSLGRFDNQIQFAPADPAVLNFLKSPDGAVPNFNPDDTCFMLSNGGAQMKHLKMYDEPTMAGPNFDDLANPEEGRRAFEKAVDYVQDLLRLNNRLPRMGATAASDVRYDPRKSSGVHYRLMGMKTRGEAYSVALAEAENALVALLEGEYVEPRPTRMGGRGKPVMLSETLARASGVVKGRAIHMTDTRDHIILGYSEQALNDAWKAKEFPISVGRGWMHGDATEFIKKHLGGSWVFCFDAEKFDASLHPWFIHIAILIMREQFVDGLDHEFDMYWQFVEESLLHSFVFRDDGIIFEKRHGTSSGHNHNSLAQSICTCIMAAFHTFYLNPDLPVATVRRNLTFEGLGDDNITIETEVLKKETVEERGMRNWEVFRVSWLGSKSFEAPKLLEGACADDVWSDENMFGCAQYLGKYFREATLRTEREGEMRVVIPYRPLSETVIRLLYPEHLPRWTNDEELRDAFEKERGGRLKGHFIDGSGNPKTRDWLDKWWDWAIEAGYKFPTNGTHCLQDRWERLRVEVDEGLAWNADGYEEWLKLVCVDRSGKVVTLV